MSFEDNFSPLLPEGERNKEENPQTGIFEFDVSKNIQEMVERITNDVLEEIQKYIKDDKKTKINIVTPAGSTADVFLKKIGEEISNKNIDLNKVHFYVGEEVYPVSINNPYSFSGRLQRNLLDKINIQPENVHLFDNSKTKEEIVETFKQLEEEGVDIFMAGLNESGAISALRSSLQWEEDSLHIVHINFDDTKNLTEPVGYKKVHPDITDVLNNETINKIFPDEEDRPTDFYTFGYAPIINSKKLMILASGKNKKPAVERILTGLAAESKIGEVKVGGKRTFSDMLQSTSTSDIINARHKTPEIGKDDMTTTIYLDTEAVPNSF